MTYGLSSCHSYVSPELLEALVTTCQGLVVAVPLMFVNNYLRDRVTQIGQQASGQCDLLLRTMTAVRAARAAGAAAGANRP